MTENSLTTSRCSRQEEEVILQEEFTLAHGRDTVVVKLTEDSLSWTTSIKRAFAIKRLFSDSSTYIGEEDRFFSPEQRDASMRSCHSFPNGFRSEARTSHRLNISDVVGCDTARGNSAQDRSCYLRIYAYPVFRKFLWKESVRKRKEIILGLSRWDSFEQNREEVERWQSEIKRCIRKHNGLTQSEQQAEDDDDDHHHHRRKKLLVLVNPFSGPGKALHVFQSRIIPILAEAGVPYETVVTKHNGHAREVAKDLDIESWGGIVVVSGDGLIYEVINGLMERADRLDAIKIPIGALPGGSGNALATSILYQAGESIKHSFVTNSALLLTRGRVRPMDLVALDTCTGQRLYSFLSVAWGMISDIDIESERYRNLGKARFTVGAVARILGLRKYSGTLHYLPINPAYKCKWSTYDKSPCEVSTNVNRHHDPSEDDVIENRPMNRSGSFVSSTSGAAGEQVFPTPLLSPLGQPVPDNWVTMTASDFVSVSAVYQTHLSQDMKAFPHSRLKDGCIYLAIIRGDVSRYKLIQFFNALDTGTLEIMEDDFCEVVKVAAFRLEPGDSKGIIAVDGELVDCGPIQGQVVEGIARVFS